MNRPSRLRAPLGLEAGFTLIELMVVVMIVSIVAVLAIPSLSHEGYERRAYTDAASVAELVREARTRAVARGAAELLVMTGSGTGNAASFKIYEAVTAAGGNIPASSCNAPTVWPGAGTATANLIDGFQIAATTASGGQSLEALGNINMRVNDPVTGNVISATNLYLCFTPAGRTWYATGTSPPTSFATSNGGLLSSACTGAGAGCVGAVTVDVALGGFPGSTGTSSSTSLIRTVWIPPSGNTRITSQ